MLNMLSTGNATECLVEGMTTLQASHHNGSATRPERTKWPKISLMSNLNGCRAITTGPYNCRGVPNALYAFKGQYN